MLLSASHISKSFSSHSGTTEALRDVSVTLGRGEIIAIIGTSGCGKSTLLRILAGLIAPSSGDITIEEKTPIDYRKMGNMSFVFQKSVLFDWRTVQENLLLPTEILGLNKRGAKKKASELLEMVGLDHFEKAYPSQLSGGMRQRVAFARALMIEPHLLLLDEPFSALDEITRENLWVDFYEIWQRKGLSVILVTHSIREAVFFADRILLLSPRPGKVEREFSLSLPRVRDLSLTSSQAFLSSCQEIRSKLSS